MANGIFAMLVVLGSLIGFLVFTYILNSGEDLGDVYNFYNLFLLATTALTICTACEEDVVKVKSPSKIEPERATRNGVSQSGNGNHHVNGDEEDSHIAKYNNCETTSLVTKSKNELSPPSTCSILCSTELPWSLLSAMSVATSALFSVSWNHVRAAYWLDPNQHHDFFVVTISRGFYYMGVSSQTFLMYFLHDIINDVSNPQQAVAVLSVVGFAAGACTSYPVGYLSDKLGKRRKPYVYMSCLVLAGGTVGLLFCRHFHQVMILSAVVGCANGAYLAMDTSLAVDTLPDKNDAAKFLGIWGVAGFFGSAMGPMLGGPLLYRFGSFVANQTPVLPASNEDQSYSIVGYGVVFCLSAVYFACSAISLRWVENCD
jgi:hypothetical protein